MKKIFSEYIYRIDGHGETQFIKPISRLSVDSHPHCEKFYIKVQLSVVRQSSFLNRRDIRSLLGYKMKTLFRT